MTVELEAVKRGYAYVEMNERGRYFSEGDYEILGAPLTDADDALDWLGKLPWSADKVGLIGCSSTAEWQLAVAARGDKALATFIPESFGAGVGRVAPYYEQGNWFRGGAVQMLFGSWLYDYGFQNDPKPMFPRMRRNRSWCRRQSPTTWIRIRRRWTGQRLSGICRKKTCWRRWGRTGHLCQRDQGTDGRQHDRADSERSRLVQGRPVE